MALQDAGWFYGNNPIGTIGVYYFPKLGIFLSSSQAVLGDLVYYDNGGSGPPHIAVYAGNGQAVHGGFSGANVVLYSVNLGSVPRYLRVPQMSFTDAWGLIGINVGRNNNSDNNGNSSGDSSWQTSGTIYTSTASVNDLSYTIQSATEVNSNAVFALLEQCYAGIITYEEMVASLNGMGYSVV